VGLKLGDIRGVDEPKASVRVYEAPDQPAGGCALDPDFRTSNPEHLNPTARPRDIAMKVIE
jgi:hypothetical protein